MSRHYFTSHRFQESYPDDEEMAIPAWAWPLIAAVIMLILVVR